MYFNYTSWGLKKPLDSWTIFESLYSIQIQNKVKAGTVFKKIKTSLFYCQFLRLSNQILELHLANCNEKLLLYSLFLIYVMTLEWDWNCFSSIKSKYVLQFCPLEHSFYIVQSTFYNAGDLFAVWQKGQSLTRAGSWAVNK